MEKAILGIDVSKQELAVVMLVSGRKKSSSFNNTLEGYKKLQTWIEEKVNLSDVLACAEATGHYSEGVAQYLSSQGCKVGIINPYCIKAYANSKLARHKNDKVDAGIIAEYARVHDITNL